MDGSGVERGLAVTGGAFLIGARAQLPGLLQARGARGVGQRQHGSAEQVRELSRLRRRVMLRLTLEDARRYLPALGDCAPQALRLSIAATGGGDRLALTAHYGTAAEASGARRCLAGRAGRTSPLATLAGFVVAAGVARPGFTTRLRADITDAQLARLLDELAWALRAGGQG